MKWLANGEPPREPGEPAAPEEAQHHPPSDIRCRDAAVRPRRPGAEGADRDVAIARAIERSVEELQDVV